MKRAIHRLLMQPLARQLTRHAIPAESTVHVGVSAQHGVLEFIALKRAA